MQDLIKKYRASLKMIRQSQLTASEEDKKNLEWMAGNLLFSIEWMRTGRKPGPRRGIERRAAYQRVIPVDPILIQKYNTAARGHYGTITQTDLDRIKNALSVLTDREREIYLMAKADCFSYSQIADRLKVKKATVQAVIRRADEKITAAIKH